MTKSLTWLNLCKLSSRGFWSGVSGFNIYPCCQGFEKFDFSWFDCLLLEEEEKERRERSMKRSSRQKELVKDERMRAMLVDKEEKNKEMANKEERTRLPTWRRGSPASPPHHQYHQSQSSSGGGNRNGDEVDNMIATVQDLLRPAWPTHFASFIKRSSYINHAFNHPWTWMTALPFTFF